jgi:1,3-beta-glucan synthase
MLVVFVALIAGPIIGGKYINTPSFSGEISTLIQPTGLNHNDTLGNSQTGTALLGAAATSASSDSKFLIRRY